MINYIPKKGDVFEWCEEEYTCIETGKYSGVVNPKGETYYLRNFIWNYMDESPKFLRVLTENEFNSIFK